MEGAREQLESRWHSEAQARQLQRLMEELLEARTPAQACEVALEHGISMLGASSGVVALLSAESSSLELAGSVGSVPEALKQLIGQGLAPGSPLGEALRLEQPVLHGPRAALGTLSTRPCEQPPAGDGSAALVVLPLLLGKRHLGVMGLVFPELPSPLCRATSLWMLASHCALALEHTRLLKDQRQAQQEAQQAASRLRVLSEASHAFSKAGLDLPTLLQCITRQVCTHLADGSAVSLVSEDGQFLEFATLHHNDPDFVPLLRYASQQRVPLGEGFTGRVALSGEPLSIPHLELKQLLAQAAPNFRELAQRFPCTSLQVVPLRARGRVLGTLSAVRSERSLTPEDQALLEQLAERAALALMSAQHLLRVDQEQFQASLLARVSRSLSEALDYEDTLQRLVELCVPVLADWCTLNLLDDNQCLCRVAVRHRRPDLQGLLEVLERRYPPSRHRVRGLLDAMQSGEPQLSAQVDDSMLVAAAQDEEHLRIMRELGVSSCLVIPLAARGRTIGVLSLMRGSDSPRYGQDSVELARELSARAALAVDNARLNRELREAVRLREEFLSIASHELRTPLTPLHLKLQLLRREAQQPGVEATRLRERVLGTLDAVEGQMRRLVRLLDELIDVSRIRQGRLSLAYERVDLAAVVRDVVMRFAPQAAKAGCELRVEAGQPVAGQWDAMRLEQVVVNLLSNALKYGANRPVGLRVQAQGQWAVLQVRDEGIGIALEDQTRIFERFERAVSERHYGGLGLGLYITREILRALGGHITVQSAPGQGACFEARLPLPAHGELG